MFLGGMSSQQARWTQKSKIILGIWLILFWKGFKMSLYMDKVIIFRSIVMFFFPFSRYFSLNLFNLNFRSIVLLWIYLILTSLLSLNSYFNSIWETIVPLVMLLVRQTPVGLRFSTLLSFEKKVFPSWNDSSQSLYNEWWYGGWTRLSNEGLCT